MVDAGVPINNDVNRSSSIAPNDVIYALADGALQMLASAGEGKLAFDPQTGQSLLAAVHDALDELNGQDRAVLVISIPSKLGTTAGGRAIAQFNSKVAGTDSSGFLRAHQQFQHNLATVTEAIKVAMANYARTEQRNAQSFHPGH